MKNNGENALLISSILTGTFLVFNCTGIIHWSWALALLTFWGPILLMYAIYGLSYQLRRKYRREQEDDFSDEPVKWEHGLLVIYAPIAVDFERYVSIFRNECKDVINNVTYLHSEGNYIAIFELEKKITNTKKQKP